MLKIRDDSNFKRKMKISNEQLLKLLPTQCHWLLPTMVGESFVGIPIKNFRNICILSVSIPYKDYCTNATKYLIVPVDNIENNAIINENDLVCKIHKEEGDIVLELFDLYYEL